MRFFSRVFGQLNYFFDIETIQPKIKTANISAYFLKMFNFMKTIHVTSPIIIFSCFLGWEERNNWNGLVWSFERALIPGDGQVRCWQTKTGTLDQSFPAYNVSLEYIFIWIQRIYFSYEDFWISCTFPRFRTLCTGSCRVEWTILSTQHIYQI